MSLCDLKKGQAVLSNCAVLQMLDGLLFGSDNFRGSGIFEVSHDVWLRAVDEDKCLLLNVDLGPS